MLPLVNLHTEYSFRSAYGRVSQLAELLQDHPAIGVADFGNTFSHAPWAKACAQYNIKPVFGVTLAVVNTPHERIKEPANYMPLIALNNAGLQELYELVTTAYDNFYYVPRIGYDEINSLSLNVTVLSGPFPQWGKITRHCWQQLAPGIVATPKENCIAAINNSYPTADDEETYQLLTGKFANSSTFTQHIPSQDEWLLAFPGQEAAINCAHNLLEEATAQLPKAGMVRMRYENEAVGNPIGDIEQTCWARLEQLELDEDERYTTRLQRELKLIEEKDYADYFCIVADMVEYAKQHMLVGPARGSAAGSLVCWLTGITEVDPIQHDLLFERFIDVNRMDLPDIDIDFPDSKRHLVISYLEEKYGRENVCHIGTVSRLMPKSAITEFAKGLNIPGYETADLKRAIIERSSGDARAAQCIEDTFTTTDVGKAFIEKYPAMRLVANVEGHARHTGTHAAGMIVANDPVTKYGSIDTRENVIQLDKYNAEDLNLLKIDALGLRTLTILEEICDAVGLSYQSLYNLPLDDAKTFQIFNDMRLAGVFQFEGYALQSLTRQMGVHNFYDIVAITALARPGPLHNGGATEFIQRRTGRTDIEYIHPFTETVTQETYGTVVYQEQVMQLVRKAGLSWEDTSELRKAMSKSKGEEFFNRYWEVFKKGCASQNIDEPTARKIWKSVMTFGSWAFNKSHAVSYGLVSYWTAYMKAHHPLAFAQAALNHARDDAQGIKILRDLDISYKAVDPDRSTDRWEVDEDEMLIGPLTLIKGIGPKLCENIMQVRPYLTERQKKLLTNPVTAYDELYPAQKLWGDYYKNPQEHGIVTSKLFTIAEVQENGKYIFIGRLIDRNLRDLNEYGNVVKRGGRLVDSHNLFLNITLEDDTDSIICTIGRYQYEEFGKPIVESGKVGEDWFLVKGIIKNNWRKIYIERIKCLTKSTPIESQNAA